MRWFNPGHHGHEPAGPGHLPEIIPLADAPYTGQDMELGDIQGPLEPEVEDIAGQPYRHLPEPDEPDDRATTASGEEVTYRGLDHSGPAVWV